MKRFVLIVCILLSAFLLISCSSYSSDWHRKYIELRDKYDELLSVTREIYDEVYADPYDLCVEIAEKHDKKNLFPPHPNIEDLDAILYCYIEGEPEVTKAEARQAYAAYKEYAAEMASILYRIQHDLSTYFD